jgi:hypothetical protein
LVCDGLNRSCSLVHKRLASILSLALELQKCRVHFPLLVPAVLEVRNGALVSRLVAPVHIPAVLRGLVKVIE